MIYIWRLSTLLTQAQQNCTDDSQHGVLVDGNHVNFFARDTFFETGCI